MGQVIAIALQKGGVGKTTTAVNTAAILAEHGEKVLVIDFDGQANATLGFGFIPEEHIGNSVLEWINNNQSFDECVLKSGYGVDVIPANDYLSGLTVTVMTNLENYPEPMLLLKSKIDLIKKRYDYIFIDMAPELGFFTINGLSAADNVIIPLQCEPRASRGVAMLLETIENIRKSYNPNIKVLGILPTMFNRNTNISTSVLQQARRHFEGTNIKIFDTTIYRTVKFGEADYFNKPAVAYSDNEQIQNYRNFVKEVFKIG